MCRWFCSCRCGVSPISTHWLAQTLVAHLSHALDAALPYEDAAGACLARGRPDRSALAGAATNHGTGSGNVPSPYPLRTRSVAPPNFHAMLALADLPHRL